MPSFLSRLLRQCANALISYGQMHFFIASPDLEEPARGHPDRMACKRPLTDTEKALARQLEDVGGDFGRGRESP